MTSDTAEYGLQHFQSGLLTKLDLSFFWQFKIFSMFLQVNEFFKSRKQEIKNQSWYVSLPPQCSQNCCSVTGEGRDQGPGVTTGCCSMQKTLQNWAGACSKIIRKVRTLQCCSDGLSQLGDLCFVPGDLYLDFEILHQKWNDWKGRVLCQVLSKMRWIYLGLIWIWCLYLRKNQYKNRLNLKRQICYVWIELRRMNIYITIMILN